MVLLRVTLGVFHLHTVMSGWVGGWKCWDILLMTGRSDRMDNPRLYFWKMLGFFWFFLVEELFESKLMCFTLCQISNQIFASLNVE